MKYFQLRYDNGNSEIVKGKNALQVIKKYDLSTRHHINTIIRELQGEQKAIAISNEE